MQTVANIKSAITAIKLHLPAVNQALHDGDADYDMLPEWAKNTPAGERERERLVCLEEAVSYLAGALEELEGSLEFPYPPELNIYNV